MILVESDSGVSDCVIRYFHDRFEVVRSKSLVDALSLIEREGADVLLADLSAEPERDAERIGKVREDHPRLKVVLTYLATPEGKVWDGDSTAFADLVVRKPYRVSDLGRMIAALDAGSSGRGGETDGG